MNVYQKILVKLYEETNGKITKSVDFKELIKKEGFYPSYNDIFKQLSQSGWITEAGRPDAVNITHWGVMEAKKVLAGGGDSKKELEKAANRLKGNAKQLLVMTEELASDISAENFELVDNKFDEVKNAIEKLKPLL